MAHSLFKDLKSSGFHSSITTTYSVDPAFYDATIQYKLRVYGCRNNILLADQGMLTQALESTPEAFRKAGLEYVVKGFRRPGSFHPKIFLRYGKNKARIVIGSANATCAGWGRNLEVIAGIDWKRSTDSQDNAIYLSLVQKTHNYLMRLLDGDESESLHYKLNLIFKESPWLAASEDAATGIELEDGSLVDVLFGLPGQPTSLFQQFFSKIEGQPVQLSVISPYWDSDLSTLKAFRKKFDSLPAKIWLNMKESDLSLSYFPIEHLPANSDVEFFQTPEPVAGRFPHAKIICLHTKEHDYILFGSANCTYAALGSQTMPGMNDEACVFRRLPSGTLAAHLGLNESQPIQYAEISSPLIIENQKEDSEVKFDPGELLLFGRRIVWNPIGKLPIKGSKIIIAEKPYQVTETSLISGYVLVGSEDVKTTLVAVVETANGRQSRPVIIEVPEALKSAAPTSIQKSLQDKLDSVIAGGSDLMDLARDMHLIFARDPEAAIPTLNHRGKRKSQSTDRIGVDYDSPEEFRAALSVSNKMNRHDLSHAENPALQAILKIILTGMISFADAEDEEAKRKAEMDALKSGDSDDGSDHQDTDDYENEDEMGAGTTDPEEQKHWNDAISASQFSKNQAYLLKAIDELENQISALAKNPEKFDLDFITQILFVFYLMIYGCSHEYRLLDGTKRTLIAFGFSQSNDRSNVFLNRAARMVHKLWGDTWEKNLLRRVAVDTNLTTLPAPIFTLVVLSRWIMAALLVEVSGKPEFAKFKEILETMIPKIFENTFCFDVYEEEMLEIITEIQTRVVSNKLFGEKVRSKVRVMTETETKLNL